jgi:hypothetical protein
MFDLPPYVDRCALIRLETLAERRANACDMLIFDILGEFIKLVVSDEHINAPWYHNRRSDFLQVDFHLTNYGVHELLNGAVRWSVRPSFIEESIF